MYTPCAQLKERGVGGASLLTAQGGECMGQPFFYGCLGLLLHNAGISLPTLLSGLYGAGD